MYSVSLRSNTMRESAPEVFWVISVNFESFFLSRLVPAESDS